MNVRNKIISEYSMNGYKNTDRAEAEVLKTFVSQGIKKYNSKMEKNVCVNCYNYTDTDDDIIFYNELENVVIVANANIEDNKIISYNTWKLK